MKAGEFDSGILCGEAAVDRCAAIAAVGLQSIDLRGDSAGKGLAVECTQFDFGEVHRTAMFVCGGFPAVQLIGRQHFLDARDEARVAVRGGSSSILASNNAKGEIAPVVGAALEV